MAFPSRQYPPQYSTRVPTRGTPTTACFTPNRRVGATLVVARISATTSRPAFRFRRHPPKMPRGHPQGATLRFACFIPRFERIPHGRGDPCGRPDLRIGVVNGISITPVSSTIFHAGTHKGRPYNGLLHTKPARRGDPCGRPVFRNDIAPGVSAPSTHPPNMPRGHPQGASLPFVLILPVMRRSGITEFRFRQFESHRNS